MYRVYRLKTFTPKTNTLSEAKPKSSMVPFDKDINFTSLPELFANPASVIQKVDYSYRTNLYYTLYDTVMDEAAPKARPFVSQEVIAFDCDNIEVTEDGGFSEKYAESFFQVTGLDKEKTVVIASGNGLHFVALMTEKITSQDFFKANKKLYSLICSRLDSGLKSLGLQGKYDASIFDSQRVLRLPGSWNEKPGRPKRLAQVVQPLLEPQTIDLEKMAGGLGLKEVKPAEEKPKKKKEPRQDISPALIKRTKFDTNEVLSGCSFLQWVKEDPSKVGEPEWHAAISILSKLDGGEALCHDYSKGHPDYSFQSTSDKYQFAAKSDAGPRTCDNIDTLWGKCKGCKNYGKKASPLLLESEDFIGSEENGFMIVSKKGTLSPDYVGLRKKFEKEHAYLVDKSSDAVFVYNGKNYQEWTYRDIVSFANNLFSPEQPESVMQEFFARVKRGKQASYKEFNQGDLINFQNGVLEVKSGRLLKHSPDFRFLYVLPFDYDPAALSPEFDKMMQRISVGDKGIEKMLLEFTGYAVCDRDYWLQKCVILEGSGSNGKSTFLEVVKMLAGKDNYSVCSMADLNDEKYRHMLIGKIINISEEMPSSKLTSTENFKKLFGGELTYRQIYQAGGKFVNSAKLFFACNQLPTSYDPTDGFTRRVEIIPFNAKFEDGKKDHALLKKLTKETPGIFNRCYKAWLELKDRGSLYIADSAAEEKKEYQDNIDSVGAWLRENTEAGDGALSFKEALAQFNQDAKQSGRVFSMNKQEFASHLKRLIPDYRAKTKRQPNGGPTLIRGLKWRAAQTQQTYSNGKDHSAVSSHLPSLTL